MRAGLATAWTGGRFTPGGREAVPHAYDHLGRLRPPPPMLQRESHSGRRASFLLAELNRIVTMATPVSAGEERYGNGCPGDWRCWQPGADSSTQHSLRYGRINARRGSLR